MKFAKPFGLFLLSLTKAVDSASVRGGERRLQDDIHPEQAAGVEATVHLVTLNNAAVCVEQDFRDQIADLGGSVVLFHSVALIATVEDLPDEAVDQALALECVAEIDEDESFILDDELYDSDTSPDAETQESPENPANAFFYRYGYQWNMDVINAKAAWDEGELGSEGVTVAILDTGIDYTHVDLRGRVDLEKSASFVPWEDFLVSWYFGHDKHSVTDLGYHGTHVANTVVSNGYLLAGVTSKTTLVGVKVCKYYGSCSFSSIVAGMLHAVDVGVDIVNMSLGGGFSKTGNGRYVGYLNKLFNYARSKKVTVVVAAGNSATDLSHNGNTYATYCDTPSTLCVSATNRLDAPTGYTNYGNSIDVAAPGGDRYGPVWAACSRTSLLIPVCQKGDYIVGLGGTSMASPQVAGLAALVVANGAKNPAQVKAAIRQNAVDLGDNGEDPYFGQGRIDVAATLGIEP